MESRAKLLGHPVHQMLITFPIGAFGFSVASDALHTFSGERRYAEAATQALDFGLVTAALAIPFGAVDWFAIPHRTRAKRVGLWHALGNTAVVGLLGASRLLRARGDRSSAAKWLSGAGFLLSGVTAWLGGELVDRHGIGVHDEYAIDPFGNDTQAPPSFSDDAPTLPGLFTSRERATAPR
jgi:uncharacterized membrane protein